MFIQVPVKGFTVEKLAHIASSLELLAGVRSVVPTTNYRSGDYIRIFPLEGHSIDDIMKEVDNLLLMGKLTTERLTEQMKFEHRYNVWLDGSISYSKVSRLDREAMKQISDTTQQTRIIHITEYYLNVGWSLDE